LLLSLNFFGRRTNDSYSDAEAQKVALLMVNQVINEDFYSGLIAKFINYDENKRRSNFETHEDYSGCIYSTIFQPVAAGYGDRVSVIEEKNIMSLDLNFFNFINN
jgi:hypothetical protein